MSLASSHHSRISAAPKISSGHFLFVRLKSRQHACCRRGLLFYRPWTIQSIRRYMPSLWRAWTAVVNTIENCMLKSIRSIHTIVVTRLAARARCFEYFPFNIQGRILLSENKLNIFLSGGLEWGLAEWFRDWERRKSLPLKKGSRTAFFKKGRGGLLSLSHTLVMRLHSQKICDQSSTACKIAFCLAEI